MPGQQSNPLVPFFIEQYRRAVIVYFFGCEDEDKAMQDAGIASAKRAVQAIEHLGDRDRRALIPLLNDPDQGVRVYAAGDLLKVAPDLAIPVLNEIHRGATTYPRMTAGYYLDSYRRGKFGK